MSIVEELERRIETDLLKVDDWSGTTDEERNLALELMRGGDNEDDLIRTFGGSCLQVR